MNDAPTGAWKGETVLNNNFVRIAIFIVLVIILYYLVITLGRSMAEDPATSVGALERLEEVVQSRESAGRFG